MSKPTHDYYARKQSDHHGHDHAHNHDHDHDDHAPVNEHDNGPPGEYEIMSRAMQELLEQKGVITAAQVAKRMELFDEEFPYRGAQVVARAWVDPAFKQRLLADGRAACAEMGALLGMPPTWYKSRNYRSRVVFEPRAVLKEFGTDLPGSVTVRVHDSNADMRYLVVPMRPQGTEGWSEEKLAGLISRDMLVGVTVPQVTV